MKNWLIWLWPYLNHKPIPTPGQTEEELRRAHSLDGVNCSIPDTVVSVGVRAFQGCSNLKTVRMPSSGALTSIGAEAFVTWYLRTTNRRTGGGSPPGRALDERAAPHLP